jgi:hypothetical protein
MRVSGRRNNFPVFRTALADSNVAPPPLPMDDFILLRRLESRARIYYTKIAEPKTE